MENQLEKKIEHDMETGIIIIGGIVCWIGNGLVVFANGGGGESPTENLNSCIPCDRNPQKGT